MSTLESDNASLESRVSTLENTFAGVTRTGSVLKFEGMNLQVVNGAGRTTRPIAPAISSSATTRGVRAARIGSHYLVVGDGHEWTS